MRSIAILFLAVFASSQLSAHEPSADQAQLVSEATAICARALEFAQGDRASLVDAKAQFSAEGWAQFTKRLNGWRDDEGAPTFTSHFRPSGPALDVRQHDGVVDLTIPGVLEQENRNPYGGVSRTKYRSEIDIEIAAATRKVTRLNQRTCGGAGSHPSCR